MRGSRFALSFALLLLVAPAWADDSKTYYVAPADLPPQLLPAPPAEGSAAWKVDMQGVIAAQQKADKADIAAERNEQHIHIELMTSVIGHNFTRDKYPKTYALLDHVFSDALSVTEADKQFWHTRRPYLADKDVKLMIDPIDSSPGYPSGHTSSTRVLAEVLGQLYPERLNALRAKADRIAEHRIEAGVHTPTDIEGGRMLAMLITGALMKSEDFQDDLLAAKQEIAANKS